MIRWQADPDRREWGQRPEDREAAHPRAPVSFAASEFTYNRVDFDLLGGAPWQPTRASPGGNPAARAARQQQDARVAQIKNERSRQQQPAAKPDPANEDGESGEHEPGGASEVV